MFQSPGHRQSHGNTSSASLPLDEADAKLLLRSYLLKSFSSM
jgi:hypothetical protein